MKITKSQFKGLLKSIIKEEVDSIHFSNKKLIPVGDLRAMVDWLNDPNNEENAITAIHFAPDAKKDDAFIDFIATSPEFRTWNREQIAMAVNQANDMNLMEEEASLEEKVGAMTNFEPHTKVKFMPKGNVTGNEPTPAKGSVGVVISSRPLNSRFAPNANMVLVDWDKGQGALRVSADDLEPVDALDKTFAAMQESDETAVDEVSIVRKALMKAHKTLMYDNSIFDSLSAEGVAEPNKVIRSMLNSLEAIQQKLQLKLLDLNSAKSSALKVMAKNPRIKKWMPVELGGEFVST